MTEAAGAAAERMGFFAAKPETEPHPPLQEIPLSDAETRGSKLIGWEPATQLSSTCLPLSFYGGEIEINK
jgi:hypothetical protein